MVLLASLIHVARATIIMMGLAPIMAVIINPSAGLALIALGLIELLGARWLWSLKIEAWGVTAGVCFFHLLFPIVTFIRVAENWWQNELLFLQATEWAIMILCFSQLLLLAMMRLKGFYSFESLAKIDSVPLRETSAFRRNTFSIVVLAQLFKAALVLLTGVVMLNILIPGSVIPWLPFLPVVPMVLLLGMLDLVAALGLIQGRDWAFHLTLLMCAVGFVETILTLVTPVLLISPWIVMLFTTCIAKDGFYYRLQRRRLKTTDQRLNETN